MRHAGFNTVKFWACWSWMAPTSHVVDFADLDELLDLARANDLRVVLNTILENAPYRLEQQWPEARYLDAEDRPIHLGAAMNTPGGGWPGLCFDNDEVWAEASRFLIEVVERFRDHPALGGWDVWNEPHLEPASYFPERTYCYCDASLGRFRAWLQSRYDTLTALNDAWSRRYSSWDQVEPPRIYETVPDQLDWREFWFDNLARWLRRRVDVVRAADPAHPVMTHVALSGFTGQLATHVLDEYTLVDDVDAFGTSSFPTWLMGDDHVEHLFNLDTARSAARGKPFWQSELQGGRGRRYGAFSTPHPAADTVELWMWNALASGAAGVLFWQWRPELLGPESPGYGLTTPAGEFTDRVVAASRFARSPDVARLRDWRPDRPSAALIVSRASALHAWATDRAMDLYRDAVLGAYRLLTDADVFLDVLHDARIAEGGVPEYVRTLYWPMPAVTDERLSAALTAFVQRGGTLVSEAAPGEYDAHGRRRPLVPPDDLAVLFGVRQVDADIVEVAEATDGTGSRLTGAWQREWLELAGAKPLFHFGDGTPAVTGNHDRDGRAILIATYPSLRYAADRSDANRAAIVSLLAGAEPAVRWGAHRPGLLSRTGTLADGRPAALAVNWRHENAQLRWGDLDAVVEPRSARLLVG